MTIATFNINNINKRLQNLLHWLEREKPDVVCLQELKAEYDFFPADALRSAGYESVWVDERSWHGVAILARGQSPIVTHVARPGNEDHRQARYVDAAISGLIIACRA
jgi:exodeoxyribonuclease-3